MHQTGGVLRRFPSLGVVCPRPLVSRYSLALAVYIYGLLKNGVAPGLPILLVESVAKPHSQSQTSEDNQVLLDSNDDKDCSYHPGKPSNFRVIHIRDFVCHIAHR